MPDLVLAIGAGNLRPVLYRVDPRDVTVFAVVVMLVVVNLLASLLPAPNEWRRIESGEGAGDVR